MCFCFSSSHSSPAQSLNVSMCSDVNDVEDGELDVVEDKDEDAAMASPRDASVADQGWKNPPKFLY